jgi:hypothetical protein
MPRVHCPQVGRFSSHLTLLVRQVRQPVRERCRRHERAEEFCFPKESVLLLHGITMTAVNVMEISQRMEKNSSITSILELVDSLTERDIAGSVFQGRRREKDSHRARKPKGIRQNCGWGEEGGAELRIPSQCGAVGLSLCLFNPLRAANFCARRYLQGASTGIAFPR